MVHAGGHALSRGRWGRVFEPAAEGMSTDERAALQQRRLRELVQRLLDVDGIQGRRLRAAGVARGEDLDGLAGLPTTSKQDLWDSYPLGMLAVPRDDVVAVHGSSGTGGRPTLVGYTRTDLDLWARMCARALAAAGAAVVPMSAGQTERQLRMLQDLRPDILTCTPSYAVRLGEAARDAGVDLAVRAGIFGAEPWSESLRRQIED